VCAAAMLRVADCVADCIGFAIPQATEGQHIGNKVNAAMIFMASVEAAASDVASASG
jgi:hypothetical protein